MFHVKKSFSGDADHEILIIGIFDQGNKFGNWLQETDGHMQKQLIGMAKYGDLQAKKNHVTLVYTLGLMKTKRLLFIGLGKKKQLTREILREAFGKALQTVEQKRISKAALLLDTFLNGTIPSGEAAKALGEAFAMALYRFPGYKQKTNIPEVRLEEITVYAEETEVVKTAVNTGYIYGKAVNSARTLVNTPHNLMTASDLADYAKALAEKYDFEIEILEKEDMMELGMGALLAVNRGSEVPPKMIVLKYQGKKEWKDVIGLVGKGITYDTGGYSLKTRQGMQGMKTDMAGAAAVLGAMEITGKLKPEQNVVAVIPATDNMVSSTSFKPDDVITSLSGMTIEVTNTDAEGRLVLADAITYAKQHGADVLVDVATLTGGVITALGSDKTGAMTNNEWFYKQVLQASKETDEMIWQLPITEKDREKVRKSKIADLDNSPSREGHAIMGGAFLGEFAGKTPWVHLDIAGTATVKSSHNLGPSGGTGVMVRTLAVLVQNFKPEKQ